MDYFDRLTAFAAYTQRGNQENEISTEWHEFIMQCDGIGSTD
jgi:hypothetical protein